MTRFMQAASAVVLALAFSAGAVASVQAADPFYKGKRITVLINYSPGGGTDVEGRLVMRHLVKHIPGKPKIIVKNMAGGGGLIGVNHLGEKAKKDGRTMGFFSAGFMAQLLGDKALRVDYRKFLFIAGGSTTDVAYVRTDVAPGIKTPADLMKATGIKTGGFRVNSVKDLTIRMQLDLLGLKYGYVTGYRGNSKARAAVQQNEINYFSESMASFIPNVVPTMVKTNMVIPLFHAINFTPEGQPHPNQPAPEGVPSMFEFYKKHKGGQPSGKLWQAYKMVRGAGGTVLRWAALPPGSPKAAQEALTTAFLKVNDDPAFQADALKTIRKKPRYFAGSIAHKIVANSMDSPEDLKSFLRDYVAKAKR